MKHPQQSICLVRKKQIDLIKDKRKDNKKDNGESLCSSQEPQVIEMVGAQEPIKRRKEKLEAFRF